MWHDLHEWQPASKLSIWGSRDKSRESITRKETRVRKGPRGFAARSRVLPSSLRLAYMESLLAGCTSCIINISQVHRRGPNFTEIDPIHLLSRLVPLAQVAALESPLSRLEQAVGIGQRGGEGGVLPHDLITVCVPFCFQDVFLRVIRQEGVFALWKGFTPYYFRIGPHTVLTFVFLEQFQRLARQHFGATSTLQTHTSIGMIKMFQKMFVIVGQWIGSEKMIEAKSLQMGSVS